MEIDVRDVSMSLGGKEILTHLNLSLKNKEFVGLIGPNGSGKSTFLKCVYRTLQPTGGAIFFDGAPMDTLSYRDSAQKLSVVAQHNVYSFDFAVLDIVLMGRAPYKKMLDRDDPEDYEIARRALATVGLAGFEKRNFATLSGGEQQRVILARALTQQTGCMILDEPTNHLDVKYQMEIMDIVKSLHLTVMAAIHDLNIAALYCDRLIALQKGRIVGEGAPETLLSADFIRRLYGVEAIVEKRPHSGRVYVVYLSKEEQAAREENTTPMP
ncbi:MAG: ABC transporter ATP-binding protein [Schwartzia sp. (in: firmicutes)]